ncbi:MAG TPA: hypothetical protein DCY35_01255, partial [Prolixibacteraceae bacterium]|nr:hypothetical protein [Prolixibacteraceae bacterium]
MPGFVHPPRGYGQIPFYWWVGDRLEKDRLVWQLDKLKGKNITGVQINYPCFASKGEPANPGEPAVFSDAWWELWTWYVDEVKKRDMAVGFSDYTIHWESSPYYMDEIIDMPGVQGMRLNPVKKLLSKGQIYCTDNANSLISVVAYRAENNRIIDKTGIDLISMVKENGLAWTAPEGNWIIIEV